MEGINMQLWIKDEFKTSSLGDHRLNKRCIILMNQLSNQRMLSIPSCTNGWHETKAAYRFFENGKVTSAAILAPHKDALEKRAQEYERVFLLQDTTELNYLGQKKSKVLAQATKVKNDLDYYIRH